MAAVCCVGEPLDPPASVREIVARLERAGFETWCVGGAVRDAMLGQAHLDWDLATAATPQQVMREFKRTVPVGVEFGTVGVLDNDGVMHEVTTFRRDVKTDGRHAVVEFGASLDEDLARRDFTINAMAYHPQRAELRDPYEGQLDIRRGLVRAVGIADERMREDRLRALRAIRFASRFSFHIDPATFAAIKASAPFLTRLSPERVHQELAKTMEQVAKPSVALEWWREAGALAALVPLIASAPDERFRALDLLPTQGNDGDRGETLQRLAMLFFGDPERDVARATRELRFSNAECGWVSTLAGARHELGNTMDAAMWGGEVSDAEIRRWVATVGRTRTDSFIALTIALWRARLETVPGAAVAERLEHFAKRAGTIAYRDPIELADLAVDGEDLGRIGITPGPKLGKVLHALLELVITDPKQNSRERLLEAARAL